MGKENHPAYNAAFGDLQKKLQDDLSAATKQKKCDEFCDCRISRPSLSDLHAEGVTDLTSWQLGVVEGQKRILSRLMKVLKDFWHEESNR